MTLLERLRAAGAPDDEARAAAAAIAATLPAGCSVDISDEALEAARRGDRALLALLLAEESQPDDDEREALRELDGSPELRQTTSLEKVKARR